jgi:hypothetical protein
MEKWIQIWLIFIPGIALGQMDNLGDDTIHSYKPEIQNDSYVYDRPDMSDIIVYDSVNNIKIFWWGDKVYLTYKDTINKNKEPFPDNWIFFPILEGEILEGLTIKMEFIQLKTKSKQLLIKWESASNGNRVWFEREGQQIWDLKTRICFFDFITRDYTYMSGAGDPIKDPITEECSIITEVIKMVLIIKENSCSQYPKKGNYKLVKNNLIRQY